MANQPNDQPKHRLADLRAHLFTALEGLSRTENPLDVDRARAIADVSKEIISSARVELDFLKLVGQEHLPRVVDPNETAKFLAEENDPRCNPHSKGLGTGKTLGRVS